MWLGASNRTNTAPIQLIVTGVSSTSITLSWTPGGGFTYSIFANGTLVQTGVHGLVSTVSGLTPSTSYVLQVRGSNGYSSNIVSATTSAASGGAIVFKPAIRARIGGYAQMQSLASMKAVTDSLWGPGGSDINDAIAGICLSPTFGQLEGATLGDYSAGFAAIGAMISLMKSYSPPKDVTIEVNCGGNGWTPQTGFLPQFCPAYMNNATYGGGMTEGTTRPIICYWNQNVANRLIALFAAYNSQFGPDTNTGGIYRWDPIQEISVDANAAGYSPAALLGVWPSLMAGLRSAAPNTMIMVKPTFINPNTGASYPGILSAALANHISMASEDCQGSGFNDWGMQAYLGGWPGFATTNYSTNNGGNPGWDFHCNVDPAELWNNSNNNAAIPPATKGSGYLYDVAGGGVWTKVKLIKATHVDVYIDAFGGPNINRRTFNASAPANPPLGPGAGLVAATPNIISMLTGNTAHTGIIANGCAIPWIAYPSTYP